ncbi:hypothetical protein K438DRAFT_1780720 [Mycena galopus ATCC 62051]|nr:hypothetical protein K438DRAFT_1780720 [Mycena galopus ATCC 62051]
MSGCTHLIILFMLVGIPKACDLGTKTLPVQGRTSGDTANITRVTFTMTEHWVRLIRLYSSSVYASLEAYPLGTPSQCRTRPPHMQRSAAQCHRVRSVRVIEFAVFVSVVFASAVGDEVLGVDVEGMGVGIKINSTSIDGGAGLLQRVAHLKGNDVVESDAEVEVGKGALPLLLGWENNRINTCNGDEWRKTNACSTNGKIQSVHITRPSKANVKAHTSAHMKRRDSALPQARRLYTRAPADSSALGSREQGHSNLEASKMQKMWNKPTTSLPTLGIPVLAQDALDLSVSVSVSVSGHSYPPPDAHLTALDPLPPALPPPE